MSSKEPDPRVTYADIIDRPRPEPKHPRMSLYNRAAQFAPFAALTGYDDMIEEEERLVEADHMRRLEPDEAEMLNRKIRRLIELTESGERPTVSITYYEPDPLKNGGEYVTITDAVKRVDAANRVIELTSMEGFLNRNVAIERISWIEQSDHLQCPMLYRS